MIAQGEAVGMLHLLVGPGGDGSGPVLLESKRRSALNVAEQLSMALALCSAKQGGRDGVAAATVPEIAPPCRGAADAA